MSIFFELKEKFIQKRRDFTISFNPMYLWITVAWIASKIYQFIVQDNQTVWERLWNKIVDILGNDDFTVIQFGTGAFSFAVMLIVTGIFTFMDFFWKPENFKKYKIQLNTNEPPSYTKFKKAVLLIIFNQIFVSIPASFVFYYALKWRGLPDLRTLESFPVAIVKIFVSLVFYEVTFYINHRILHHKLVYKHIHKIHHEWIASVSIIALYAHPVEHLFVNLGSVFGAVVFTNSHIATGWVWIGLLMISTLVDHSGYHVPFTHSSQHHDYHHLKFNVNYGGTGMMDSLFGTDKAFRNTVQQKRHETLYTLKSARDRIPDPTPTNVKGD